MCRKVCYAVVIFLATVLSSQTVLAEDISTILETHFKAVGGIEKLASIKTFDRLATLELNGDYGKMVGKGRQASVVGEKSYDSMDFGPFAQSTIWNGQEGWNISSADGTTKLSGVDLVAAQSSVFIDPLESAFRQGGILAFERQEDTDYHSTDCYVLAIRGTKVRYFLSKQSGLLVGFETPTDDADFGETTVVIHYSDYISVSGVMFPNRMTVNLGDGAVRIEYTFTDTKIDVTLPDTLFDKP